MWNWCGSRRRAIVPPLEGLHKQFDTVAAKKKYNSNDVAAGREFVNAYVEYVHYVERLYDAAGTAQHAAHAQEKPAAGAAQQAAHAQEKPAAHKTQGHAH
jgi:hypothetical protein